MTTPSTPPATPSPGGRGKSRRILWLFLLASFLLALGLLFPASPFYLPELLVPRGTYDGRSFSDWRTQLDSASSTQRTTAVFAMGAIGQDAAPAVPTLARLLEQDQDSEVRRAAAHALYKIAPASADAVPVLARALTDKDLPTRMNALLALSRLGKVALPALPALLAVLDDNANRTNLGAFHHTIRELAILTIGKATATTDQGLAPLLALLEVDDTNTTCAIILRALGEVGSPASDSMPRVARYLDHKSSLVRESAEQTVLRLGGNPDTLRKLNKKKKKEAPPADLPESESAYLWQIENRGNQLNQVAFPLLASALRDRNKAALARILAEDFQGRNLAPTVDLPGSFIQGSRSSAGKQPAQQLDRQGFVDRLMQWRNVYADRAPGVQISLKNLWPKQRGNLDGPWEGTCLLRFQGERAAGAPAEIMATLRFAIPVLSRERFARDGWLQELQIEQVSSVTAPRYLFTEMASRRGIDPTWLHDNWSNHRFETVTGGVYVTDFNRDGYLDILITDLNGVALYQGGAEGQFRNVTRAMQLPRYTTQTTVAAWVDIDGDGWEDLILGQNYFRNREGQSFEDVTARSQIYVPTDASGILVADYDRDGKLDLYVTRTNKPGSDSWLSEHTSDPRGNVLLRNMGNWRFEDVTRASGASGDRRSTFTAAWLDANDDGWPDLHVPNEFGNGQLLINNRNGTFSPRSLANHPVDFGSMGLAVGDINNDGRIDLYCANMYSKAGTRVIGNLKPDAYAPEVMAKLRRFVAGSQLHLNQGNLKFEQAGERMHVAPTGWAYGACLADLDNDGWLDIYATAGYMSRSRTEPDG